MVGSLLMVIRSSIIRICTQIKPLAKGNARMADHWIRSSASHHFRTVPTMKNSPFESAVSILVHLHSGSTVPQKRRQSRAPRRRRLYNFRFRARHAHVDRRRRRLRWSWLLGFRWIAPGRLVPVRVVPVWHTMRTAIIPRPKASVTSIGGGSVSAGGFAGGSRFAAGGGGGPMDVKKQPLDQNVHASEIFAVVMVQ